MIKAPVFFSEPCLEMLLEYYPMVVPFWDLEDGCGLFDIVHSVSNYLCESLTSLLHEHKGLGGFKESWSAFQLELALEEMFFGRCAHHPSRPYSASLGVCASDLKSFTFQKGFLGLSPVGCASVGTDPPPLKTWMSDVEQQDRIMRVFPLSNTLKSSPAVIGDALILVLLGDLCKRNNRLPVAMLKGPDMPFGKLTGFRSVDEFAKEVVNTKVSQYFHEGSRDCSFYWS